MRKNLYNNVAHQILQIQKYSDSLFCLKCEQHVYARPKEKLLLEQILQTKKFHFILFIHLITRKEVQGKSFLDYCDDLLNEKNN